MLYYQLIQIYYHVKQWIDQQILECVLNDVFNENNNKHPIYFDIQENEKEVELISYIEATW